MTNDDYKATLRKLMRRRSLARHDIHARVRLSILRARRYRLVSSVLQGHSGNTSLWRITPAGQAMIDGEEQPGTLRLTGDKWQKAGEEAKS